MSAGMAGTFRLRLEAMANTVGDRLTVGLQVLVLGILVRIQVPEPRKMIFALQKSSRGSAIPSLRGILRSKTVAKRDIYLIY